METRGAKRKHNPHIPAHIDQSGLPKGVYWDKSGNGRWYTFITKEGRPSRETIAGPNARNSDLHRFVEESNGGPPHGTIRWMLAKFHDSTHFKDLAVATKRDYEVCRAIVENFPTKLGIKVGALVAARLAQPNVQAMHEKIVKQGTPSKANHVLRYLRRMFGWAIRFGLAEHNPAKGVRQVKEKADDKMPTPEAFAAVQDFVRARGQLKAHTRGSVPPYLDAVMTLAYNLRLRGIEVTTLTDAHIEKAGIRSNRRKGSRDNVTRWNSELRAAWDWLIEYRRKTMDANKRPIPLKPERRRLLVSQSGTPLTRSALSTAWQRAITMAILERIIPDEDRFTLHGLKHRGITDTKGTRAVKHDAGGHATMEMTNRYDHDLPLVSPPKRPKIVES